MRTNLPKAPYPALPRLTTPYRALPRLTATYIALSHLTAPYRSLPRLTAPYSVLPRLNAPYNLQINETTNAANATFWKLQKIQLYLVRKTSLSQSQELVPAQNKNHRRSKKLNSRQNVVPHGNQFIVLCVKYISKFEWAQSRFACNIKKSGYLFWHIHGENLQGINQRS